MKKSFLLLAALLLPLAAMGQSTLKDMTNSQIDRILNSCNKIIIHTSLLVDNGEYTDAGNRPEEDFTLILDYPLGGCDFYIGGKEHGYHMSKPMRAKRMYTNDENQEVRSNDATHLQFYFFDNHFKENALGFDFRDKNEIGILAVDMLFFQNQKTRRAHRISSVDFYDKSGDIIAKSYIPAFENDKENGNLLRCFIDDAYNKYK